MEHEIVPTVNQIACQIQELEYVLATTLCDQCQQPATRFTTATRTAIDIHLDHPVLLHITVSVHHCTTAIVTSGHSRHSYAPTLSTPTG